MTDFKIILWHIFRGIDVDAVYDTILAGKFGFALSLLHNYRKNKNLDIGAIFKLFNGIFSPIYSMNNQIIK